MVGRALPITRGPGVKQRGEGCLIRKHSFQTKTIHIYGVHMIVGPFLPFHLSK